MKILVTGASGYVGGRLTPLLLARGHDVRVFVRSASKLKDRPWAGHERLEIFEGDVLDRSALDAALEGCEILYYFIHSMSRPGDFSDMDRRAAYNTAEALQTSGVRRVIYLSGLLPPEKPDAPEARVSPHLRSREEVGRILSLGRVPVTIFQASQIIGVGSASFEMLRRLADHLPIMLVPRWVDTKTQPISMSNMLEYLAGVLDKPETTGQTYAVGGPDVISYRDLINAYTDAAGVRRRKIVALPGISLRVFSLLVGLVTPVPSSLAAALMEGLRNEVVCPETRIRDIIPQDLLTVKEAVNRALGRVRSKDVDTSWLDAGMPPVPEWLARGDPAYAASLLTDGFSIRLAAAPDDVWPCLECIGGERGWYGANILWSLRGFMDRLAGGPGVQRGRRHPGELRTGDSLDFWRVLDIRHNERLLLLTEMRLPGEGLLDVTVRPAPSNGADGADGAASDVVVSLYYRPRGLRGRLYWHAVKPFHALAFKSMLRAIAEETGKPVLSAPVRAAALPLNQTDRDASWWTA